MDPDSIYFDKFIDIYQIQGPFLIQDDKKGPLSVLFFIVSFIESSIKTVR